MFHVQENISEHSITLSLRDKFLKLFLLSQLDVSCSSTKRRRTFVSGGLNETFSQSLSGLRSYSEFSSLKNDLFEWELLKSCHLSQKEIKLLGNCIEKNDISDTDLEFLKDVHDKIELRLMELESEKPQCFSGAVPLNRHEYEEECSYMANSETAEKLGSCLIKLQPYNNPCISKNHPINFIKELEKETFQNDANSNNKARKRKCNVAQKIIYLEEKPKSFWDMKAIPVIQNKSKPIDFHRPLNVNGNFCCKNKKVLSDTQNTVEYIDQTKSFSTTANVSKTTKLLGYYVLKLDQEYCVPVEKILKNKISEINYASLSKNKDSQASSTLYVKNLSKNITPFDLASIFGNFESDVGDPIHYRILNGKMKGQAFVKLASTELTKKAMETCKGYLLKDKPIVIEYGYGQK